MIPTVHSAALKTWAYDYALKIQSHDSEPEVFP